MPVFEFSCPSCGLRFEKLVKDKTCQEHSCLDCGAVAQKQLSSFGFRFEASKSPGPTGVDSLDSNVDKIVGRDADKRWEYIKDRNTEKRRVQGSDKVPLRKNPMTGEYEVMKSQEVQRFQKLHAEYSEIYEEHKRERQSQGISKFKDNDPYARYREKRKEKSGDQ
jgi:putative FmdB family regulatory protein